MGAVTVGVGPYTAPHNVTTPQDGKLNEEYCFSCFYTTQYELTYYIIIIPSRCSYRILTWGEILALITFTMAHHAKVFECMLMAFTYFKKVHK